MSAAKANAVMAGFPLHGNPATIDAANKLIKDPKDHLTVDSAIFRTKKP